MSIVEQREPSPLGYAIAGALTAVVTIPIIHPTYTVCTLLVIENKVKNVIMPNNRLAFPVLYRGALANGVCDLSGQITLFYAYGLFRHYLETNETISGLGAAGLASPVYNFWDRVMTVQQATGKSLKKTLQAIISIEGKCGIFKGTLWTFFQESLYQPFFFSLSKKISKQLNRQEKYSSTVSNAVCYLVSGLSIGIVTTPFQYVRTLMYNEMSNRSLYEILKDRSWGQRRKTLLQFAQVRTPFMGITMLITGLAKDFFLNYV
jgi:hypothetical protein